MSAQVQDNAALSELVRDLQAQQKQLRASVGMIKQNVLSFLPPSAYSTNYSGDDIPHTSIDQMVKDQNDVHQSVTLLIDDISIFRREQHEYNSSIQKQMEFLHGEVRKIRDEQKLQQSNVHTCDTSVKTQSDHVYLDQQKLTGLLRSVREQQNNLSLDMASKVGRVDTKCSELEEALLASIQELTQKQENTVTKVTQRALSSFDMLARGSTTGVATSRQQREQHAATTELADVRGIESDDLVLNDQESNRTITTTGRLGTARNKTYANSSRIKNVLTQTMDKHIKTLNLDKVPTLSNEPLHSQSVEGMNQLLQQNNVQVDLKESSQQLISTYFQHLQEELKKQQSRQNLLELKSQQNVQGLVDSVQTLALQHKDKIIALEGFIMKGQLEVRRDIGVWSSRVLGQEREQTTQQQRVEWSINDLKKKRAIDDSSNSGGNNGDGTDTNNTNTNTAVISGNNSTITTTTYIDKRFLELEHQISQLHSKCMSKFNEALRKLSTLDAEHLQSTRSIEAKQQDIEESLLHKLTESEGRLEQLMKRHVEGKSGTAVQPSRVRTGKLAPASLARPEDGRSAGFSKSSSPLVHWGAVVPPALNSSALHGIMRQQLKDEPTNVGTTIPPSSTVITSIPSKTITSNTVQSVVSSLIDRTPSSRLGTIPIQGQTRTAQSTAPAATPLFLHTTQSLAKVNGGNLSTTLQ